MGVVFFNDTATTEIYTLSLHDALPIWTGGTPVGPPPRGAAPRRLRGGRAGVHRSDRGCRGAGVGLADGPRRRSEEHTSELQSRQYLVCRLLLEKKKKRQKATSYIRSTP